MANSQNFVNAIKAIEALTAEELNALVPYWKQAAKMKRSIVGAVKSAEFKHGDVLGWFSTKRTHYGQRFLKLENFNRARTCVVGYECDDKGERKPFGAKWTVAITMLNKHNGQDLTK